MGEEGVPKLSVCIFELCRKHLLQYLLVARLFEDSWFVEGKVLKVTDWCSGGPLKYQCSYRDTQEHQSPLCLLFIVGLL